MRKVTCIMIYSSKDMTIKNITAIARNTNESFNLPIADEQFPYRYKFVSDMLQSVLNILKENDLYVDSHITCGCKVPHIECIDTEDIGHTLRFCL